MLVPFKAISGSRICVVQNGVFRGKMENGKCRMGSVQNGIEWDLTSSDLVLEKKFAPAALVSGPP